MTTSAVNYSIIPYNEKYRDDMIFMVLEAKDSLCRIPRLSEDLLDIQKNYLDTGDMFWLAIDENDRAIKFYARYGFRFDGTEKEIKLGTPNTELRMIYTRR